MAPDKRRPRPGGNGRGPLEFIAVDNSDTWEDSPERYPPQGLLPIGPVAYRIVQRLGQRLRIEGDAP